jgi:uncharacterized protein (TIGR03083 family)
MRVVPVDLAATRTQLRKAATNLADLLGSADRDRPVPGLEWNVGDVATHLVVAIEAYRRMACSTFDFTTIAPEVGEARTPGERGAHISRALLPQHSGRDLDELRDTLVHETEAYLEATGFVDEDHWFQTWVGYPMDIAAATAAMLGEQLIHGHDIARAMRRPWIIEPDAARLVHAGTADLLPNYLAQDIPADARLTIEIRISGGPRFVVAIRDGVAAIHPTGSTPRPECHLSADPVTLLLGNYRRIGRLRPLLTGKVRAGGRRPWRTRHLQRYLTPA